MDALTASFQESMETIGEIVHETSKNSRIS